MKEKIFSKMREYGWSLYGSWHDVYNSHYDMMQDLYNFLHLLDDYQGLYEDETCIDLNDIDQQKLTDLADFMSDFLRAINDIDKEGK